ncbi:MAG TPA: LPS assembly lipoprotein LptE [Methylophilaceae bacterium]|nr:LPS assembly lipoprotein LptE [Methylophilaceae bacterium]
MSIFSTHRLRLIFTLVCALALSACGFQMRGLTNLSFENLYIQDHRLSITKALKKSLSANGVTVVTDQQKADLMLELMSETSEQKILSLSGGGKVREFELIYRVNFRLRDPSSELWGQMQTVEGRRDFSYDDSQLLAKQFEEARLFEDIKTDAVREIMRRLVVQKPAPKPAS